MSVFTPLNTDGERLSFPKESVRVLEGDLHSREIGTKATVEIDGTIYQVIGAPCHLPNCHCDAVIIEVKEVNYGSEYR